MVQWARDSSFDLFQLPDEHNESRAAIWASAEKEIAPYATGVAAQSRCPEERFMRDATISQIY